LICRAEAVKLYERDLMESFKAQHLTIGGFCSRTAPIDE
jgi:hypothetical protein